MIEIKTKTKIPNNIDKKFKYNLNRVMNGHSANIVNSFQREYESGLKTGRKYGKHTASGPNETPAKISGNLGNNFFAKSNGRSIRIGNNLNYGYFLEFGTKFIKERKGELKAIKDNGNKLESSLKKLNKGI